MELMASPEIATLYFYPRPPRGGRRQNELLADVQLVFLSTPSARRATQQIKTFYRDGNDFYPRPPRGGRRKDTNLFWRLLYFYPRPPRGGRRRADCVSLAAVVISIHALREEGDLRPLECSWVPPISIHALREEGDAERISRIQWRRHFYPRPPRGGRPQITVLVSRRDKISIHALREEGDGNES